MKNQPKTSQSQNRSQTSLRSRLISFASAIILLFTFVPFSSAYADDEPEPVIPPLEISPVSTRVSLNQKEQKPGTIEVKNYGNEPLNIRVYPTPFSNADGNRNFKNESDYTKISHWIKIKDDSGNYQDSVTFTMTPKQTKTISYKIDVPSNAPAGGQYATIFFESLDDQKNEESIKTTTRVGMLIYANVAGELIREANIINVRTNSFITSDNLKVSYTVENKGNIDFQASTTLQVSSLFGRQLYNDTELTTVFPDSSENVEFEWKDTPGFGLYNLHYKIRALDQTIEKNELILVASPFALIIIGILIVVLILAIVYRARLNKTRK